MSDTPKAFIRSLLSVEEVEAIIAERDAARAHVERLTAALEIVANHPEKSQPGANPSYTAWGGYFTGFAT